MPTWNATTMTPGQVAQRKAVEYGARVPLYPSSLELRPTAAVPLDGGDRRGLSCAPQRHHDLGRRHVRVGDCRVGRIDPVSHLSPWSQRAYWSGIATFGWLYLLLVFGSWTLGRMAHDDS